MKAHFLSWDCFTTEKQNDPLSRSEAGHRRHEEDAPRESYSYGRLVDYELTAAGQLTSNPICKECGAVTPEKPPRESSHY